MIKPWYRLVLDEVRLFLLEKKEEEKRKEQGFEKNSGIIRIPIVSRVEDLKEEEKKEIEEKIKKEVEEELKNIEKR